MKFLLLQCSADFLSNQKRKSVWKKIAAKPGVPNVSIDDGGLHTAGDEGDSNIKWSALMGPAVYDHDIYIKFRNMMGLWLEDAALMEGTAADVRLTIASHLAKHSVVTIAA